jgi:hypothetical protein
MIVGAVHSGGYPIFLPTDGKARGLDALDVFETCVERRHDILLSSHERFNMRPPADGPARRSDGETIDEVRRQPVMHTGFPDSSTS